MFKEPVMAINGKTLTVGQAMTVRVALGAFAMSLLDPESLGSDETGRGICKGYRTCLQQIHEMMEES